MHTENGYYEIVPQVCKDTGVWGEYLDAVGPYETEKSAHHVVQGLIEDAMHFLAKNGLTTIDRINSFEAIWKGRTYRFAWESPCKRTESLGGWMVLL